MSSCLPLSIASIQTVFQGVKQRLTLHNGGLGFKKNHLTSDSTTATVSLSISQDLYQILQFYVRVRDKSKETSANFDRGFSRQKETIRNPMHRTLSKGQFHCVITNLPGRKRIKPSWLSTQLFLCFGTLPWNTSRSKTLRERPSRVVQCLASNTCLVNAGPEFSLIANLQQIRHRHQTTQWIDHCPLGTRIPQGMHFSRSTYV